MHTNNDHYLSIFQSLEDKQEQGELTGADIWNAATLSERARCIEIIRRAGWMPGSQAAMIIDSEAVIAEIERGE